MYLATYNSNELNPESTFPGLEEKIGFKPIWCMAADSPFDLWANSMLNVIRYPEILYLIKIDAHEVLGVRKTEWENHLAGKGPIPDFYSADTIPEKIRFFFDYVIPKEKVLEHAVYKTPIVQVGKAIMAGQAPEMQQLFEAKLQMVQTDQQYLETFRSVYLDTDNSTYQYNKYIKDDEDLPTHPVGFGFTEQFTINLYGRYSLFNTTNDYLTELHDMLHRCYYGDQDAIDEVMNTVPPLQ